MSASYSPLVEVDAAPFVNAVVPVEVIVKRPKVIVVDDELNGSYRSHLNGDAILAIGDTTSIEYEHLLEVARRREGFALIESQGNAKIRDYFGGDELIHVILSDEFHDHADVALKDLFRFFFDSIKPIRKLRDQIIDAFPEGSYELVFAGSDRPDIETLLEHSLLILDLVLNPAINPIDSVVEYLKKLSNEAGQRSLPPIILMSSHADLQTHRLEFSTKSQISAAGLLVVPKGDVARETFGAQGLQLTYKQLQIQRDIAHKMRLFMKAWMNALDLAQANSIKTIWNLDAAAMQQLHHTAHSDNDPYDDHLNELIAREYLWHVESDSDVDDAINALDEGFQGHIDCSSKFIKNSFVAPFVEPEHVRTLQSRYTWTGWRLPPHFVGYPPDIRGINKRLPFGALLMADDSGSGAECLVHITQQCDLNDITRKPSENHTLTFSVVTAVEVFPNKVRHFKTENLVARGLKVDKKEFDFVRIPGRMLALSVLQFIQYSVSNNLRVRGRLRHDIATQFLQATANHMTRPASQKLNRSGVADAMLSIHGQKLGVGNRKFLVFPDSNQQARMLQATLDEKVTRIQSAACFDIALWVKRSIEAAYGDVQIDAGELCKQLLLGVSPSTKKIGNLSFKTESVKLEDAITQMGNMNTSGLNILLVIFTGQPEEGQLKSI